MKTQYVMEVPRLMETKGTVTLYQQLVGIVVIVVMSVVVAQKVMVCNLKTEGMIVKRFAKVGTLISKFNMVYEYLLISKAMEISTSN